MIPSYMFVVLYNITIEKTVVSGMETEKKIKFMWATPVSVQEAQTGKDAAAPDVRIMLHW